MATLALYDDDIYAWAYEQAATLRRLAETRRDLLPSELDLTNISEEIEDVGSSELRRVETSLELLLRHLLKFASAPETRPAKHWEAEARLQHRVLVRKLKCSMLQNIDVEQQWEAAKARADAALDEHGQALLAGLPERCPFSLDELVAEPFDIADLLRRLTGPL